MYKQLLVLAGSLVLAQSVGAQAQLRGPYLGQTVPGMSPQLFAPGVISTEVEELNSVFSPDGKEFFFAKATSDGEDPNFQMYFMTQSDRGVWSEPKFFPGNGPSFDMDMEYSNDGDRIYWVGLEREGEEKPASMRLYYSDRSGDSWSKAKLGPDTINAFDTVLYPSIVANDAMYFSSRGGETKGGLDIFRSEFKNGAYQSPENIGEPINTEAGEVDLVVAPDESYMILSSRREGGHGAGDLYISFKQSDGRWGELKNMGPEINSSESEYCPKLSHDGKYFFWTSQRSGEGDIYWVDAKIIDRFRS